VLLQKISKSPFSPSFRGKQRNSDNFILNVYIVFYGRCEFLAKKKGDKYKCEECGLIVLVEDPCGCETCELVCCSEPMKPVKAAKAKAKPKAKK
jgi:hypothetical protein